MTWARDNMAREYSLWVRSIFRQAGFSSSWSTRQSCARGAGPSVRPAPGALARGAYISVAPGFPVCVKRRRSMISHGAPGAGGSSAVHSRRENYVIANGRQFGHTLLVSVHQRVLALASGKSAARSRLPTNSGPDARANRKTSRQPEPAVRLPLPRPIPPTRGWGGASRPRLTRAQAQRTITRAFLTDTNRLSGLTAAC